MRALQTLNHYFWKYRWRLLLGFAFIIMTNIFAVKTPELIRDGVSVLNEANSKFFQAIYDADAEGKAIDKDALVSGESLTIPENLQFISDLFGISADSSQNMMSFNQLLAALVEVGVLLSLLYVIIYLIKGVFLFFTRQTIIVMSRLIEYDQKNEIYEHYQKLNTSFYKRNRTGDLMNRISEDVSKVRMYLGPAVMYTLNLVVLIVLVVWKMIEIDPGLTLYVLLPLPFMSICIYYVSNTMNRRSEVVQRQQSKLSTIVQEAVSGVRVLKAYNREKYSDQHFSDEAELYKTRVLSQVKVDALFMPIIVLLVGMSTILAIYIGGRKVIAGELGVAEIFQVVFYVNMLTWPFASVGWVTSLVQKAEASQQRINEFLAEEPEIQNQVEEVTPLTGNIEFDNVSYVYPDSGIRALKDINFKINSGETLAIIGRTGSGKSTIANLLVRHFDPTDGAVKIDGTALPQQNLSNLRDSIGYVPQEVFLFSETIGDNIAFGVEGKTQEEIEAAAQDAQVHHNIVDFPEGYSTLLGERGINLSGGQKQRISIARAIIKNPRILIFDDCLSAVDTQTEEAILQNLKRIMADKTTILISHRVSTVKHAHQILVMDDGKIVERGTHEDLLDQKGVYSSLYQKQLLEEQES